MEYTKFAHPVEWANLWGCSVQLDGGFGPAALFKLPFFQQNQHKKQNYAGKRKDRKNWEPGRIRSFIRNRRGCFFRDGKFRRCFRNRFRKGNKPDLHGCFFYSAIFFVTCGNGLCSGFSEINAGEGNMLCDFPGVSIGVFRADKQLRFTACGAFIRTGNPDRLQCSKLRFGKIQCFQPGQDAHAFYLGIDV